MTLWSWSSIQKNAQLPTESIDGKKKDEEDKNRSKSENTEARFVLDTAQRSAEEPSQEFEESIEFKDNPSPKPSLDQEVTDWADRQSKTIKKRSVATQSEVEEKEKKDALTLWIVIFLAVVLSIMSDIFKNSANQQNLNSKIKLQNQHINIFTEL